MTDKELSRYARRHFPKLDPDDFAQEHRLRELRFGQVSPRYTALAMIRRSKRQKRGGGRVSALLCDVATSIPGPSDLAATSEETDRLLAAIAGLSAEYREVIRLRLDGLTDSEIADRLSLPAGTVKTRLHRARERLQDACKRAA